MALAAGQVLEHRYRIDALLGQGGMGVVYQATDLKFRTSVAVKENRLFTPESLRQFIREAELLHRLRHPNLPRVTDYFYIAGDGQYLVMDYIEGGDLDQVVKRQVTASHAQILHWVDRVLEALDYLHSEGVIHRDVKPTNIKVTSKSQVYLVDFGLAKEYDPLAKTTLGARGVTPGYAPPEQYGHGRTDERTDIFSAGATLYALLIGAKPPDALECLMHRAELVPPRQIEPTIPAGIEAAILKAMQLQPDDRFQRVADLGSALKIGGQAPVPVTTPPGAKVEEPQVDDTPQGDPPAEPGSTSRRAGSKPAGRGRWSRALTGRKALWIVLALVGAFAVVLLATGGWQLINGKGGPGPTDPPATTSTPDIPSPTDTATNAASAPPSPEPVISSTPTPEPSGPPSTAVVDVPADTRWVNTGVWIEEGDTVHITPVEGNWRTSPAAGWTDGFDCAGEPCTDCVLPGEPEGSLIAITGSRDGFCVGRDSHAAESSGQLSLSFNDAYISFADNEGVLTVKVRVERP